MMFAPAILLLSCLALRVAEALRPPNYCDPSRKDEHCPPNPAFASISAFDFSATTLSQVGNVWADESGLFGGQGRLTQDPNNGAVLEIEENGQEAVLATSKYLFFGKVTVEARAAPGPGVITAIALKSDSGNEIVWEIIGAYDRRAQSNYFYDGNLVFNTYSQTYKLPSSVFSNFHRYTVEWTESSLVFYTDGVKRKTMLVGKDIPQDRWPQTPMKVMLRLWAVRDGSDAGEIAWAGGKPLWGRAPFTSYFKKVDIEDYAGYCEEMYGPVKYAYDGRMSGWEDVRIDGCSKGLPAGPSATQANPANNTLATSSETQVVMTTLPASSDESKTPTPTPTFTPTATVADNSQSASPDNESATQSKTGQLNEAPTSGAGSAGETWALFIALMFAGISFMV